MHKESWPSYGMAGGEAFYAGETFLTAKIAQWVLEEGMGIDTANRGELAVSPAALQEVDGGKTTTSAIRLDLHGSDEAQTEIAVALTHHMGHLVLDPLGEVELAVRVMRKLRASSVCGPKETGKVMARPITGMHADGHEYISTGHEDQEFGLSVHGGVARQAVDAITAAPELELYRLHSHIGFQILDLAGFWETVGIVLALRHEIAVGTGHLYPEVDLGGGYGIAYIGADPVPPSPAQAAHTLAEAVRETCGRLGDEVPTVSVESGYVIAGPMTVTLYTVTGLKRIELRGRAPRLYISIDDGVNDNIRPALYEAAYTALIANRRPGPQAGLVHGRMVGRHYEFGDVVVRGVDLPTDLAVGDVPTVPATGTYGRSMASNYSLSTHPGMCWVRGDESG